MLLLFFGKELMPAEKAVLTALGIPMGDCRHPFAKLEGEKLDALLKLVLPRLEK